MKIAVLSYSFTGNNEILAESVAKELSAKHIKISPKKTLKMGGIILDMLFFRTPKVEPSPDILKQYDFILFFAPIWMGQVASPLRAYFNELKQHPKQYGFLSISGGADGGNPKLSKELLKRTGKQPMILVDQHISDLFSSNNTTTRKDTSAYKINEADVKKLTTIAIDKIKTIKEICNV